MKEINENELKDVTGGGIVSPISNEDPNNQKKTFPTNGKCPEGYILKNGLCEKATLYDESGIFKRVAVPESKL